MAAKEGGTHRTHTRPALESHKTQNQQMHHRFISQSQDFEWTLSGYLSADSNRTTCNFAERLSAHANERWKQISINFLSHPNPYP